MEVLEPSEFEAGVVRLVLALGHVLDHARREERLLAGQRDDELDLLREIESGGSRRNVEA